MEREEAFDLGILFEIIILEVLAPIPAASWWGAQKVPFSVFAYIWKTMHRYEKRVL